MRLVFRSFGYLSKNKMKTTYLWMLLIAIAYYVLSFLGLKQFVDSGVGWLEMCLVSFDMLEWVSSTILFLSSVVVWFAGFVILRLISGTMLLVLYSTLLSSLAHKVMTIEEGSPPRTLSLFRSVLRAVPFSLWNMVLLLFFTILILILHLIPVLRFVAPVLLILVNSYYFDVSMVDYSLELKGFSGKESRRFMSRNKMGICGIGLPFSLLLMVPFVGVYMSLLVVPATVIAGVKMVLGSEELGVSHL